MHLYYIIWNNKYLNKKQKLEFTKAVIFYASETNNLKQTTDYRNNNVMENTRRHGTTDYKQYYMRSV